ncbi:MAG: MlaA family lipoprotein [Rhodanobacteraceae bacterium]
MIAALTALLGACAVAPARNDDPLQKLNRKMFAFNQSVDKAVMRPVAKGYVKVTTPGMRDHIGDFFANLRTPITIVNEVLQGRPGPALDALARFMINSTAGVLGFFDPATELGVPQHSTDFGVTLADWGVPQGPFLVLPLLGPTTLRDVWRLPVDTYADPMTWYTRNHSVVWHQYAPEAVYFVNTRAGLLPYDKLLDSVFDPYAFVRDAYLQSRLYMNYHGNPPLSAIDQLQGTSPSENQEQNINQLLKQQEQYEKTHGGVPASSSSSTPAAAASAAPPPASSGH